MSVSEEWKGEGVVCVHKLPKRQIREAKSFGWVVQSKSDPGFGHGEGILIGPFKNLSSARAWAQEWMKGVGEDHGSRVCVRPIVFAPIVQAHCAKRLGERAEDGEWPAL